MASTPEGAKAIYTEKIEELQQTYNEASDSYRMVTGEYEQSKKELQSLQKRLAQVESQCEALMRMNNEEGAIIKAQERQEILEDIQHTGDMMDKYEQAMKEAKQITSTCEQQLIQMKKEMKDTIKEMQDNKRIFQNTLNGFWNFVQAFSEETIALFQAHPYWRIFGEWNLKNKIVYNDTGKVKHWYVTS